MPVQLLILLTMFFVFFLIPAFLVYVTEKEPFMLKVSGCVLLIASVFWAELGLNCKEVPIATTKSYRVDGVDIVVYNSKIINLNKQFSRSIEPDTEVTKYRTGSKLVYVGEVLSINNKAGKPVQKAIIRD